MSTYIQRVTLEDALRGWMMPYMQLTEGPPATFFPVIWETNNGPQPVASYFSLRLTAFAVRQGGRGDEVRIDADGLRTLYQRRTATLSINAWGQAAVDRLSLMKAGLYTDASGARMGAINCAIIEDTDLLDLSAIQSTKFQGRTNMDLRISYIAAIVDGDEWIEKVVLTNQNSGETIIINE